MTGQATYNEMALTNFTTNYLQNVYYTMLLHVPTIRPAKLQ
jgi:hypothetical protein